MTRQIDDIGLTREMVDEMRDDWNMTCLAAGIPVYNQKQVEEGIRDYEKRNRYRFKLIVVIGASGNVHYHVHNDRQKPPT